MFNRLISKKISKIMAVVLIFSGIVSTPAFVFADNGKDKENHGQKVSAEARAKHGFLGLGGGVHINFWPFKNANGEVKSAAKEFRTDVKEAKDEQKTAKKEAKTELKADLEVATTDQQKTDAVKTYLQKLLSAFQAFATAKENAFQAFINALGTTTTNQAPTANAQSVILDENTSKAITLTGSDPEGSSLTFTVLTNPLHGTLTGTAPNLTYTPTANYNGSDSFTFKVNDGSLNSTSKTVSITVSGVNQAPTANAQSVQVTKNTSKAITLTGSDPEGDTLTYFVLTSTNHGTLSGSAPNLSYLPAIDYTGSDSFSFWVKDGSLDSTSATVNINVNP